MLTGWSTSVPAFSLTSGVSASAAGVATVGNPGCYRSVNHVNSGMQKRIQVFEAKAGAVYDSSTQGAIASLDFSIDHRQFSGFGSGHQFGLGLRQDGNLYTV